MEIGDFVRVENSGNSYWGEVGKIVGIDNFGGPDMISINIEHDAREGPSIRQFSENELASAEKPVDWNDDPEIRDDAE